MNTDNKILQKKANVVEIGPRDGFQNVKEFIPTEVKKTVLQKLYDSGYKKIQITSFVSPKAIPQMKDATEIAEFALRNLSDIDIFALVPNYYGAKSAHEVGLKEITPVISLSESHNKANVRRSHQESLDEFKRIKDDFPEMKLTPDIATVFGCPFEGRLSIDLLLSMIDKLTSQIGVTEITLCDTIGVGYPEQVRQIIRNTKQAFPSIKFNLHVHDTRNMGVLNSYIGILEGVNSVQTSLGGLGGCPFAPGATGNTSSEDLIYMLQHDGWDTGISFDSLLATAKYLHGNVQGNYSGHHIHIKDEYCCL